MRDTTDISRLPEYSRWRDLQPKGPVLSYEEWLAVPPAPKECEYCGQPITELRQHLGCKAAVVAEKTLELAVKDVKVAPKEEWRRRLYDTHADWVASTDDTELIDVIEAFISSLLADERDRAEIAEKKERTWRLALTHLPKEHRDSVIKTHKALMDNLASLVDDNLK